MNRPCHLRLLHPTKPRVVVRGGAQLAWTSPGVVCDQADQIIVVMGGTMKYGEGLGEVA